MTHVFQESINKKLTPTNDAGAQSIGTLDLLLSSASLLSLPCRTLCGLSSSSVSSSSVGPSSPTLFPTTGSAHLPSLFPETWLPMPVTQDFLQVAVSREDRSYRTIYSLFHKTVSETKYRIIKIQRVQNPFLWEKYKR